MLGTPTTSSWENQLWYLAINQQQQQQHQQQEEPESTTGGRAFFCSSNSALCSNSVQPIIFRPVISACWDSMTPPVFQGYAFFFLAPSLIDLRQINCSGSFWFSQEFFALHTATLALQRFPRHLRTRHSAGLFIRPAMNSIWNSLGQWEIAIVSLFRMVQRDNTTQQTPTSHSFIRCHHYWKWRSYFWGAPPSLISPWPPLHSLSEDAHFAVSDRPFKLSHSNKPSSLRNQTVDAW